MTACAMQIESESRDWESLSKDDRIASFATYFGIQQGRMKKFLQSKSKSPSSCQNYNFFNRNSRGGYGFEHYNCGNYTADKERFARHVRFVCRVLPLLELGWWNPKRLCLTRTGLATSGTASLVLSWMDFIEKSLVEQTQVNMLARWIEKDLRQSFSSFDIFATELENFSPPGLASHSETL